MTSESVHLLHMAAHGLWTFGAIAGGSSVLGFGAINTGQLRARRRPRARPTNARRTTPAPTTATVPATPRQPAKPTAAKAVVTVSPGGAPATTAAGQSTDPHGDHGLTDLASELGLSGLADRAGFSLERSEARERAVEQLRALEGPRCLVVPEFELAGEQLPTLLSTSGVFVVLLTEGTPNSLSTIASLRASVLMRTEALEELKQLSEVEIRPTPVFYSPSIEAPARCWFVGERGEHRVFTAGGVSALRELLATERGPGLSETALEVLAHAIRRPASSPAPTIPDASTGQG